MAGRDSKQADEKSKEHVGAKQDLFGRVRVELAHAPGKVEPEAQPNEVSASSGEVTKDLLAAAIADVATHFGQPNALATLTAGLSLVDGRLPKEYATDAASRAGLAIETVRADPIAFADHELPVLIFTGDEEIEVLWAFDRDEVGRPLKAHLSLPGDRETLLVVPAADLSAAATGECLRLRPKSSHDQRGEGAMPQKAPNWFLSAFHDSRAIYAEAILATMAINLLALAMPLFAMNVYDRVLPNAAEATLWALALGVMLAVSFDFIIRTLRAVFVDAASRKADVRLSALIYSRLLGARLSMQPTSAGVRANSLREFETLREFFNSATLTAFGELPFLVLFLGVIWIVAGPLVFVVAASIPIILLVGWLTQRALHRLMLTAFQGAAQKNAVVVETVVGLESIKAAGAESWAAQKWERSVAEHVRVGLNIRHVSNLGQHFVQALQTLVQLVTIIVGFYLVSAGQITMGALIAATILSGRALAPLSQAALLLARLNQTRIAYQSLNEIVQLEQERVPGATYLSKEKFDGAVTFEKVRFGYAEESELALVGFDTQIEPGERVAFLGGIGSGKSTALKLVQGLYKPVDGRVLLDGVSVSQIDPALLRNSVGLLLQDAELFHGTIRENITLGHPAASDEAILRATHAAGAVDWIQRLPHGFDTMLCERGVGLSGGQRQSVALARALLGERKVILLDEPTSEMDGRTEQLVINRLKASLGGKTLILVTHRPALLQLVDRIIVLEDGRKFADGPKAEVLEKLKSAMAASRRPKRKGPEVTNESVA